MELPASVPIRVVYRLAEVRNDSLTLYGDIYRQRAGTPRQNAMNALATAGYDTTRIREPALTEFLRRAARGTASIALDSLREAGRRPVAVTASRSFPSARPRTPTKECV